MTLLEQAKQFYHSNASDGSETLQEWMAMFAEYILDQYKESGKIKAVEVDDESASLDLTKIQ